MDSKLIDGGKDRKLAFNCPVCGGIEDIKTKVPKDFLITVFDEMIEWSDFINEVPPLDEKVWQRSNSIPIPGQVKKVKVSFPFNMTNGEEFWVLFEPALSFFNGWDSYPHEIDTSAVVKCKFIDVVDKDSRSAWIEIEIIEAILLPEIVSRFEGKSNSLNHLEEFFVFRRRGMFKYNEWLFFDAGEEGDLGIWALIKKNIDKHHLIAYGRWGFHESIVFIGNILIQDDEIDKLISQCDLN